MSNSRRKKWVLYGIRNCDSCRKAQSWLKARDVTFDFHDFREDGLADGLLESWLESDHGSKLLNRRSTTWRQLTDRERQSAANNPLPFLRAHPTLIKRPVITDGQSILDVGFSPAHLDKLI